MWFSQDNKNKHRVIDYHYDTTQNLKITIQKLKLENRKLQEKLSEKENRCKYVSSCNHSNCDIEKIRNTILKVTSGTGGIEVNSDNELEVARIKIYKLEEILEEINSILHQYSES